VGFISVRWLPSPAHFPLSFERRKKKLHLFLAQNQKPTWPPLPTLIKTKEKKTLGTPWVHAEPSHWLHEILISKPFVTIYHLD
jgi:hypothetical protein